MRESEERYRTLFTSIDEGFCILEMLFDANNQPVDYRFLEINPMFESQTGLKNAIGRTARELVPDLEPHWFETYGRVALTGEPIRFTNGSEAMGRWFDVYACRIGSDQSRKVGVLFKDITERRRAEQALRESEQKLRAIYDGTYEYISLLSQDGTLLETNRASLEFDGSSREHVVGLPFWETMWFKRTASVPAQVRRAVNQAADGEYVRLEIPILDPLGEIITFELSLYPVRNEHEDVVLIVSEMRNISKRKAAEERLQQSEARLRLGMQIADFAIGEIDYIGNTILLSSEAAVLYGLGNLDITVPRERVHATFHPDEREKLSKFIANVLKAEGPGSFELEHRVVWPDGQVRWLNVHKRVFFDLQTFAPQPTYGLLAVQDITQRKQTEIDALFLADLGSLLTRTSDVAGLIEAVTRMVGEHFGASRCALHETDLASGVVSVVHDFHDGLPSLAGPHAIAGLSAEDIADFAAGQTVVRADTQSDLRTAHLYAASYEPLGIRSLVVVPLLRMGRLVAALWISSHEPREWTDHEVALLRTVAERTWLAVENARLQETTQALNNTLEMRVVERTLELQESQLQLRKLSAYVEHMREDQRTRIAREVHDELGSSLTGLKMTLAQTARGRSDDASLMTRIDDMRNQIDGLVQTVRRIASDLRPPLLDDLGLVAALEWQAGEWEKRAGIACQLELPPSEPALDGEQRTAIFRAFQESLTNVARHAQATEVLAALRQDGEHLVLTVQDNGRGISAEALQPGKSLGLMGLHERIREVSATSISPAHRARAPPSPSASTTPFTPVTLSKLNELV